MRAPLQFLTFNLQCFPFPSSLSRYSLKGCLSNIPQNTSSPQDEDELNIKRVEESRARGGILRVRGRELETKDNRLALALHQELSGWEEGGGAVVQWIAHSLSDE